MSLRKAYAPNSSNHQSNKLPKVYPGSLCMKDLSKAYPAKLGDRLHVSDSKRINELEIEEVQRVLVSPPDRMAPSTKKHYRK